jgi:hypothetical protein
MTKEITTPALDKLIQLIKDANISSTEKISILDALIEYINSSTIY